MAQIAQTCHDRTDQPNFFGSSFLNENEKVQENVSFCAKK